MSWASIEDDTGVYHFDLDMWGASEPIHAVEVEVNVCARHGARPAHEKFCELCRDRLDWGMRPAPSFRTVVIDLREPHGTE